MRISAAAAEAVAVDIMQCKMIPSAGIMNRKMKATYGVSINMIVIIWNRLIADNLMPRGASLKHLFWALSFLKTYETEHFYSVAFRTLEKTFRGWMWKIVLSLARLEVVCITRAVLKKNYLSNY